MRDVDHWKLSGEFYFLWCKKVFKSCNGIIRSGSPRYKAGIGLDSTRKVFCLILIPCNSVFMTSALTPEWFLKYVLAQLSTLQSYHVEWKDRKSVIQFLLDMMEIIDNIDLDDTFNTQQPTCSCFEDWRCSLNLTQLLAGNSHCHFLLAARRSRGCDCSTIAVYDYPVVMVVQSRDVQDVVHILLSPGLLVAKWKKGYWHTVDLIMTKSTFALAGLQSEE